MIQVLIKPNSSIFANEIINTLTEMGFQIAYRLKIHLKIPQAEDLLFHLCETDEFSEKLERSQKFERTPKKEKIDKSQKFDETLEQSEEKNKELVNFWCSEDIEVLSLVKMACKKEVLSLLSKKIL